MTIAIAAAVPDGIAFAADTQTTWMQTITHAQDAVSQNNFQLATPIQIPIGWSRMAKKIIKLSFSGKEIVLLTAGAATLNNKTMSSIFESAAKSHSGNNACSDIAQYIVDVIKAELAVTHNCTVNALAAMPAIVCEVIVAGFEDDDIAKPFLESYLVFSGILSANNNTITNGQFVRYSNVNPMGRHNACWIGETEFVSHIVTHSNPNLPQIQGQFNMMTIDDGVDYCKFIVSYTCDFQRFAMMVPTCGRPIVTAKFAPNRYSEEIVH